jgi:hypothetical protein
MRYFDGSLMLENIRAGVILISLKGVTMVHALDAPSRPQTMASSMKPYFMGSASPFRLAPIGSMSAGDLRLWWTKSWRNTHAMTPRWRSTAKVHKLEDKFDRRQIYHTTTKKSFARHFGIFRRRAALSTASVNARINRGGHFLLTEAVPKIH